MARRCGGGGEMRARRGGVSGEEERSRGGGGGFIGEGRRGRLGRGGREEAAAESRYRTAVVRPCGRGSPPELGDERGTALGWAGPVPRREVFFLTFFR